MRMRHRRNGNYRGFTLIELLVVIAIISILATILVPSLNEARVLARRVTCVSNLKGIGIAEQLYANDHKDQWTRDNYAPGGYTTNYVYWNAWTGLGYLLQHSYAEPNLMYCPSEKWWGHYLEICKFDGTDTRQIFNSYSLRGWAQGWEHYPGLPDGIARVPGEEGKSLSNLGRLSYVSCFIMYSPTFDPQRAAYHKDCYPVLYGTGEVHISSPPNWFDTENPTTNIWSSTYWQRAFWCKFDAME